MNIPALPLQNRGKIRQGRPSQNRAPIASQVCQPPFRFHGSFDQCKLRAGATDTRTFQFGPLGGDLMTTRFPPPAQAATLTRISSLDAVPKELFDKVWKLVLECGEQERHFGNLQGIYRGLASTWLLAMFAGV